MDPLRTELRSLIKIRDYLTRNERIITDIRENDKTPSWDGEIIVYKPNSTAKKDIEGRIPVQVKGSFKQDLSQKTIKYTLDCADFRNYQISNGIIIFVVYMKDYDNCKIYYNALLPFDLTKLLKNIGEQKTKTIELYEFPKDDTTEIINIFLNFVRNQKLQGGTVDQRILSLPDLSKLKIEIDGFQFGYTGIEMHKFTDMIDYSLKHPTYVYAQPKGFSVKIPVDKINIEQVLSDITSQVTVDGKVFYDRCKFVYEIENKILCIGKSFKFYINKEKLDYTLSGKLSERITDIKFLIALYSNKKIKINGMLLPLRTADNQLDNIKNYKKSLRELEEMKSNFDILGVKEDLDIDKISEKELDYLFLLRKAILYNESVPLSINNMPGIGTLAIGNLTIALICNKSENGNFQILNFFGNHNVCCTCEDSGKEIVLSPYIQLKKEAFLTISNINYSKIVESIIKAPKSEMQDGFANQSVLEMIKAYDEQKEKNIELLKSAHDIMEYISKQPTIDLPILTLNRLQIIKRMRELSPNELHEVSEIKLSTDDEEILIGASILLESFVEAKLHYDKLSEEKRKNFDTYPIANLWVGK